MSTPNTKPGPGQAGPGPQNAPVTPTLGTIGVAGYSPPPPNRAKAAVGKAIAKPQQVVVKVRVVDDATGDPLKGLAVEVIVDKQRTLVWKGKTDELGIVLAPVKTPTAHRVRVPEPPGPETGDVPEGDGDGKPQAPQKGKPKPFVSMPIQPWAPGQPVPDVRVVRPLHVVVALGGARYSPLAYGEALAEHGGGEAGRKVGAYAKLVAFFRAPDSKELELLATASDGRLCRFKPWGPIREVLSSDRSALAAFITAEPELAKSAVRDPADVAALSAKVARDVQIKGGRTVPALVIDVKKGEPQRYQPVDSRAGPFIEGGPKAEASELAGGLTPARAAELRALDVLDHMLLEFRVSEPATHAPTVSGAAFQRLPLPTSAQCVLGDPREPHRNLFVTADLDLRESAPDDPFDERVTVTEPTGGVWTVEAHVRVVGKNAFITPRGGVTQQVPLAWVKREPNPDVQRGSAAMGLVNRVYQLPPRARVVPREGAGRGMAPDQAPRYAKALSRFLRRLFRGIGYHRAQGVDPARVERAMQTSDAVLLDVMEALLFRVPTTEVAAALQSELGSLPGEPMAIIKQCLFFGVGDSPRQAIAHAIGNAAATHRITVKVLEEDYQSSQAREVTERWAVGYFKFATDHPDLDFGLRPIADRVKAWFGQLPNVAEIKAWNGKLLIDVKGYASPAGKPADNELLAKERGRRVADALRDCLDETKRGFATFAPTYAGTGDQVSAPPLHLLGAVGLISDAEAAAEQALAKSNNPATHRCAVVEIKRVIPGVTGSTEQIASFRSALPIHHLALLGYHRFPTGQGSSAVVAAVFVYPGQKIELAG